VAPAVLAPAAGRAAGAADPRQSRVVRVTEIDAAAAAG
jgi:hypothetical protein